MLEPTAVGAAWGGGRQRPTRVGCLSEHGWWWPSRLQAQRGHRPPPKASHVGRRKGRQARGVGGRDAARSGTPSSPAWARQPGRAGGTAAADGRSATDRVRRHVWEGVQRRRRGEWGGRRGRAGRSAASHRPRGARGSGPTGLSASPVGSVQTVAPSTRARRAIHSSSRTPVVPQDEPPTTARGAGLRGFADVGCRGRRRGAEQWAEPAAAGQRAVELACPSVRGLGSVPFNSGRAPLHKRWRQSRM